MRRATLLFTLLVGCGLRDADRQDATYDDPDVLLDTELAPACRCSDEGTTLTAVDGCERFGGDQEQCSGWGSCEEANGFPRDAEFDDGTELTCYGCTIRLTCGPP